MNPAPAEHPRQHVIRRAFYLSLAVIALLAVCGAGLYWLLQDHPRVPALSGSAPAAAPVRSENSAEPAPPAVTFTDNTRQAGIDFVHVNGGYGEKLMPEAIGSGVAFFDYDNDADQDLLLINSGWFPGHARGPAPLPALYQNDGKGHFTDVTRAAGLAFSSYGMGMAIGDYDNDGWTDLYLTALGRNHLMHNEHGRFRDVTEASQTAGSDADWNTAAAFVDIDLDGDLDLFVGNYIHWSRDIDLEIDFRVTGLGRAIGAPNNFIGTTNHLYRNDGDGKFTEISESSGIVVHNAAGDIETSKALAVAPLDYDHDGLPDLFVANDTTRNFLYHNLGNGRFEEIGVQEGIAYDRNGKSTSAMGIDSSWFRNDQELGLGIGNFANEMSSLFVTSGGRGPFADEAILEGFGPASRLALTFGLFFFDYDLDGRQDLFQANGHIESDINVVQPSQTYAQPAQLFWNCGDACRKRFRLVEQTGALSELLVGRGAAYADIDGDGDLDIAVAQNNHRAVLLRNDQDTGHHWLRIQLEGSQANRNAIGAELELIAGGITQRRLVMPTRSYLSQVELPVTFGLGDHAHVESLRITWPGGKQQHVAVDHVDTTLHIRQADTD